MLFLGFPGTVLLGNRYKGLEKGLDLYLARVRRECDHRLHDLRAAGIRNVAGPYPFGKRKGERATFLCSTFPEHHVAARGVPDLFLEYCSGVFCACRSCLPQEDLP